MPPDAPTTGPHSKAPDRTLSLIAVAAIIVIVRYCPDGAALRFFNLNLASRLTSSPYSAACCLTVGAVPATVARRMSRGWDWS
jgi:hypothetical protein